jgi:protein phosphatase methylesterase 1
MGGSIAAKTVDYIQKNHPEEEWTKHIKGLFIIDVAEGNALDALPFMEDIVKNRPSKFTDQASVVKYGFMSQTVRDLRSAKVSMPD